MSVLIVLALALLACVVRAAPLPLATGLLLRDVQRGIDLTSAHAKHKVTLTLANTGSTDIADFLHVVSRADAARLAWLGAASAAGGALGVERLPADTRVEGVDVSDYVVFRVTLAESLKAQASVKVVLRAVFVDAMPPHPAAIAQSEAQLVRYQDNVYFAALYDSQSQKTAVRLASTIVESYSQHKPTTRKGPQLTYGAYSDVPPLSSEPLHVHFEHSGPFLKARRAVHELEVSHWGNVAVEQRVHLVHAGARLKGAFSRYEYQRNPAAAKSAVRALRLTLPPDAADIYYRDEIGNISTSAVAHTGDGVELELVPRYVLFGGWRASFVVGYNVPLSSVLVRDVADPTLHLLNVTFFARWAEALHAADFEFSVTLPEGAEDIQLHAPFEVDERQIDVKFSYLDTAGRPVLRVRKSMVVAEHNQPIQITYRFASRHMLHEPLLLCGVFFILCLTIIVYTRTDLSLAAVTGGNNAMAAGGGASRVAECVARLRDVLERRDRLHAALDAALAKLAKTRNKAAYEAERAAVADGWAECARDAMRLAAELEARAPEQGAAARQVDYAERVRQKAHLAVAALEAAARHAGAPDAEHEKQRAELERRLQDADDAVERLAAQLQ